MNRRQFLLVSAATFSVAAIGSTALLVDTPHSFIPDLLHHHLGEYRIDPEQEARFVEAVEEKYGRERLLAFAGLYRLRSGTGLGTEFTDEKVEQYERRIVTAFLTSTDYLRKADDPNPEVHYMGLGVPCLNPYAQTAV